MNHYVYRITNKIQNKHYYGCRTSKIEPKLDLGIKYFSSSKDKEFIIDQKENSLSYKYKIVKTFSSREEAIKLEIKLHNKFNVGINESFYNRAKQTSIGFDTSGKLGSKGMLGKNHSNETKLKISESGSGKNNVNFQKIFSKETKEKMSTSGKNKFFSEEHRKNIGKSGKGRICKLETKEKMKLNYKNKIHQNALKIHIFNNENEFQFEIVGCFDKFCKKHNLPTNQLKNSYRNNGKKIHLKERKNRTTEFKGWYALKINF